MRMFLYFALAAFFVWLKVTHRINWEWWIIFAPLWGGIIVETVIWILNIITAAIVLRAFHKKSRNLMGRTGRF